MNLPTIVSPVSSSTRKRQMGAGRNDRVWVKCWSKKTKEEQEKETRDNLEEIIKWKQKWPALRCEVLKKQQQSSNQIYIYICLYEKKKNIYTRYIVFISCQVL